MKLSIKITISILAIVAVVALALMSWAFVKLNTDKEVEVGGICGYVYDAESIQIKYFDVVGDKGRQEFTKNFIRGTAEFDGLSKEIGDYSKGLKIHHKNTNPNADGALALELEIKNAKGNVTKVSLSDTTIRFNDIDGFTNKDIIRLFQFVASSKI